MICPGCAHENHESRRYCGQCGHNLRPICVRCAFTNDASDRFCGGCGSSLHAAMTVATTPSPMPQPVAMVATLPAPKPAPAKLTPVAPAKSAVASLPVPAPAQMPEVKAAAANGQPLVTAADLDFLIDTKPSANKEEATLPSRVTQGDLDSLFGDIS